MKYFMLVACSCLLFTRSQASDVDSVGILNKAKLIALINFRDFPNAQAYINTAEVTSALFVSDKCLDNLLFIKVELRDRLFLERALFLGAVDKGTRRKILLEPNMNKYQPLLQQTLQKKYRINTHTPNSVLEMKLNQPVDLNLNTNVYLVYNIEEDKFYILFPKTPVGDLVEFKKLLHSEDFIKHFFLFNNYDEYKKKALDDKILPIDVLKKIVNDKRLIDSLISTVY